jgi:hypothetical protein
MPRSRINAGVGHKTQASAHANPVESSGPHLKQDCPKFGSFH